MNSATNSHPDAGHGNGSVETQNHPEWSASVVLDPELLLLGELDLGCERSTEHRFLRHGPKASHRIQSAVGTRESESRGPGQAIGPPTLTPW